MSNTERYAAGMFFIIMGFATFLVIGYAIWTQNMSVKTWFVSGGVIFLGFAMCVFGESLMKSKED